MAVAARKYNPGFLPDDELVTSFCVRTQEFESIIEMLRECTGSSIPHRIVIGPRGSGKTSLLLRAAAEVRRDADLQSGMFPIVFAEESYEVATAGEFWLECLSRLAIQAPRREGGPDLRRTVENLRAIRDDRTLGDRCLGALQDFSDREGKRLVLMVENLNMMFRDMSDPDAGWRLRHTLQTDPRIILLASATSRFDEIDNPDNALYDLFTICMLRPLDTNECTVLWESISGRCSPPETIRSLEILTGGSPRLLAIVARFGAGLSFRELMADLLDLVDDHTEYFKGHIESLPAQERRVYLTLADLWKPATTREIADRSRLDTSKCSAQLTRLIERGVVQVAGGTARRKQYYLTERLYNIYYLLRRSRGSDRLIEALIRFMDSYYSPRELRDFGALMADNTGGFDPEMASLHRAALLRLMKLPTLAGYREELLSMIPEEFAEAIERDSPSSMIEKPGSGIAKPDHDRAGRRQEGAEEQVEQGANALLDKAAELNRQDRLEDALAVYDEVVGRLGENDAPTALDQIAGALVYKGETLRKLGRFEESLATCDEVVHRLGATESPTLLDHVARALIFKAVTLGERKRPEEALSACGEVVRRFGTSNAPFLLFLVANAFLWKGDMLDELNRPEEALAAYDEAVHRFEESDESEMPATVELVIMAYVSKGDTLFNLNRAKEALSVYEEVGHRFGESEIPICQSLIAKSLLGKAHALHALNRPEEALIAYEAVMLRFGDRETLPVVESVAKTLALMGLLLTTLCRPNEALSTFEELMHRFGDNDAPNLRMPLATAIIVKGFILRRVDRTEEALDAFDEAMCRFGESESPALRAHVELALIEKAEVELTLQRYEAAAKTADRVLDRRKFASLSNQCQGHLIRAEASLASADSSSCEQDLKALLAILVKLDSLPRKILDGLMTFCIDLGPVRMRELILASPAAHLLLPLTTALAWEIGLEPRVPQEVEEVARDIRRDLAKLRDSAFRAIVPALRDANSPPSRRGPR